MTRVLQLDDGANKGTKKNLELIHDYKDFSPKRYEYLYDAGGNWHRVKGEGFVLLPRQSGNHVKMTIFYTPTLEADVISPGFFCRRNKKHYSGFSTGTDFDTNKGFVKFSGRLTSMDIVLNIIISNDLIYFPPAFPVGVSEFKINT